MIERADGTSQSERTGFYRRLILRRADGVVDLDRWSIGFDRVGSIKLHRMDGPDPGLNLHDHPFTFVTLILWGGYVEERADTRTADRYARIAEVNDTCRPGYEVRHGWGSVRVMRLDECHRIVRLLRKRAWTLVVTGPKRRRWGFYLPGGWMRDDIYDRTVRAERRDLFDSTSTVDGLR